jgi:glycosyltransferase involved in cell wall biosynthesis
MKKILIIMQSLVGGGAEKVLIDILKCFDTNKYEVSLYIIREEGVYLNDIPQNIKRISYGKMTYLCFRIIRKICIRTNLNNVFSAIEKRLFRRLISEKYDAVISFMEGLPLKYHSFIFNKCNNNISWVHINLNKSHWTSCFFKSQEEEILYNMLSTIVFVSKDAKIEFNKLFHITKPIQKVIYNLIPTDDIILKSNEYEVEKHKFTVCCVGRLALQKRFDRAIDIAKILRDMGHDFEFWILGQGPLEPELKDKVQSLNLMDYVKFLGFIKNPYPYMKKSDIFLMTSDTEGYPLVICEAICLGLPVVSTNITGVNEILDNGKYGILTSFQTSEISMILNELMSDAVKLNNLSQLSKERAKMFNPKDIMSEIYELI